MAVNIIDINNAIENVEKQLSIVDKSIQLVCITHRTGGLKDALLAFKKGYSEEDIAPYLKKLSHAWQEKTNSHEPSEFLGTIQTEKKGPLGLYKYKQRIHVISINLDHFEHKKYVETKLYELCWHILNVTKNAKKEDDFLYINRPDNKKRLMQNLKADIFSSLAYSLKHHINFISELAKLRAIDLLKDKTTHSPEAYPFIIALDQTKYVYKELQGKRKLRINFFEHLWHATQIISQSIDTTKLNDWQNFAKNIQDMAWRGLTPEIILSISIDGNDHIETKKLGVQVASLADITPASNQDSCRYYNPFKSSQENEKSFNALTSELFETLLTRCIFENSAAPFIEKANRQNTDLQKGQFMGWCAHALQESAEVFERALQSSTPPSQVTREMFKTHLKKISWDQIKKLGTDILEQNKNNDNLSTREFINFLQIQYNSKMIADSVLKSVRQSCKTQSQTEPQEDHQTINLSGETFSPHTDANNTTRH